MSYIVLSNGSVVRKPGVYSSAKYVKQGPVTAPAKTLGVVGDFPFLEPGVPYVVAGPANLRALAPQNVTCQRLAQLIWNASNDARVASPGPVYLCSMQPSTAATRTFLDSTGVSSLKFTSQLYGAGGASTYVTIATGTSYGLKYSLSRQGQASETFDNVAATGVIVAEYTGASADSALIQVNPVAGTVGFLLNKSTISLGPWSPGADWPWNNVMSITPSAAAAAGFELTADINGLDDQGAPATETLTWPAGDSSAKTSTTKWTQIIDVTFATTDMGFAGTFTVNAIFLLPATQYPYATNVVEAIAQYPDWIVANGDPRASRIPTNELDYIAGSSIVGAPVPVNANVWAATTALAASNLCIVERIAGVTKLPPLAPASGYLLGGAQTTTTLSSVQAAFAALETENVQPDVVCLLSDDPTWQAELKAHIDRCWSSVASERIGFTGAPALESLANLQVLCAALNDADIAVTFQNIDVTDSTGATVTLTPPWFALIAASMATGIAGANSLLNKAPRVSEIYCNSAINPDRDYDLLLQRGLFFAFHSATGIRWMDDYTTYLTDVNDPFRSHVSPQMSLALSLRGVRAAVVGQIGENATAAQAGVIQAATKNELSRQKELGIIKDFRPNTVHVTDQGDYFLVQYDLAPMETTRFIQYVPAVTRIPSSV